MTIDMKKLKEKMAQLNKVKGDAIKTNVWKPSAGENKIRLVPLKGSDLPFQELYFHYKVGPKTLLSPLSYGEPDPIAEFSDNLIAEGNKDGQRMSLEDWKDAKQFYPQKRTYVPIVVRGKEEEGVKFWGFGIETYKKLGAIFTDDDYGDISDPNTGRDLTITFTEKTKENPFPSTDILARGVVTPLTKDAKLLEKLLNEQPNLLESYDKHSYAELKEVLVKYTDNEASPTNDAAVNVSINGNTIVDSTVAVGADGWGTGDTPAKPTPKAVDKVKEVEESFDEFFKQ
jgi:hypothetical protein